MSATEYSVSFGPGRAVNLTYTATPEYMAGLVAALLCSGVADADDLEIVPEDVKIAHSAANLFVKVSDDERSQLDVRPGAVLLALSARDPTCFFLCFSGESDVMRMTRAQMEGFEQGWTSLLGRTRCELLVAPGWLQA